MTNLLLCEERGHRCIFGRAECSYPYGMQAPLADALAVFCILLAYGW